LQPLVLVHQRIAHQHARHAAVLLRESEHDAEHRLELAHAAFFLAGDLVDEREQGLLDEFDQAVEHFGLALEVAVERGLRHL
jgi:hypothetical protein